MATKREIMDKTGIRMLLKPNEANRELSIEEAKDFEIFLLATKKYHREIENNIKNYCLRCRYYETAESMDKCDSWIHGCSYGVSCKYIGKAKGEDMSQYENRRKRII